MLIRREIEINFEVVATKDFNMKTAIERGDVDQVRTLLTAKADPNADFTCFYSSSFCPRLPLELAASLDSPAIVRLLLDAKGDITKKDLFNPTVLWHVRNTEIFQMLLEAKADPFHKTVDSSTLMHRMAYQHNTEIMQILLDLNVSISDRDKFGKTPLHYAAQAKNHDGIRFLLKHKANILEKTNSGKDVVDLIKQTMFLTRGLDLGTVELLETEMINAKQKQSVTTLAGLHPRAGARSFFTKVARTSTIFDQQTLRLILRLAGSKTPDSRKRKREDGIEEATTNSSLGSRQ